MKRTVIAAVLACIALMGCSRTARVYWNYERAEPRRRVANWAFDNGDFIVSMGKRPPQVFELMWAWYAAADVYARVRPGNDPPGEVVFVGPTHDEALRRYGARYSISEFRRQAPNEFIASSEASTNEPASSRSHFRRLRIRIVGAPSNVDDVLERIEQLRRREQKIDTWESH
jgi:hypothetical protein